MDNLPNKSESTTTGEKEVSETSHSEEQNDNVSANEMDDIQRPPFDTIINLNYC